MRSHPRAFSRHVATITRNLGRKAITRPWPRLPIDRRRYHTLTLTSCGLERPTDDKTANLYEAAINEKIEIAEILRDLVTQVEERAKPQEVSAAVDSKSTALVASPKKRALAEGSEKPVEEEYLVAKLTSVAGAEQITPMPTATNVELMAFGKKPAKEPKEKKEPREKKAPRSI